MPLFISVSGAVYAICRSRGKYSTWSDLINSKWRRVLLPYFLFGLIVLFPTLILLGKMVVNIKTITSIIYGGDNIKHLWYLYVLFEMFIITRIIEKYICKYKVFVFSVILCTTIIAYNICIPPIFQLNMLLRYYIYFVIGYYVGNLDNIEFDGIYSFISLVIGLLGNYLMFQLPKILFPIVSIITALSLSFFTYSICQKLSKHTKLYCCINKDGMGIYLFHIVIIYILFNYNLFAQCGIYVQALLITLISIFGSIIATRLIRSFKLGFLIGE